MKNPPYIPEHIEGHPYSPGDKRMNGWYVTPSGDRRVHFEFGQISNRNGAAILYKNGGQCWLVDGIYHRKGDLPAIQTFDHHGRMMNEKWLVEGKPKRDKDSEPDTVEYRYENDDAIIPNETISVWHNAEGKVSRKGKPAIIIKDFRDQVIRKEYIDVNFGGYHNSDGPAIETLKSKTYYYLNKKHREDGPAYERGSGKSKVSEYWLNDRMASKKEVDELFATGKSMKRSMVEDFKILRGEKFVEETPLNIQDEQERKERMRESVALWAKRSNRRLVV